MKKVAKRAFRGVWIPAKIWLDKKITPREKFFLMEIHSLDSDERGCFANNRHFCSQFGVSKNTACRVIQSLLKKRLITCEIDKAAGFKRKLKIVPGTVEPYTQKRVYPLSPFLGTGSHQKPVEAIPKNGDSPIPRNGEHRIPSLRVPIESSKEKGQSFFSDVILDLELKEKIKLKAAQYELDLQAVLPARTNAEKSTYAGIRDFLIALIIDGKKDERIFHEVIGWAKWAASCNQYQRPTWVKKLKTLGYRGKGRKLLIDEDKENRKTG